MDIHSYKHNIVRAFQDDGYYFVLVYSTIEVIFYADYG